jgi:hypothetical protein
MLASEVYNTVLGMIKKKVEPDKIRDFIYSTNPISSDISTGETMVLAFYYDGTVSYTANFNKVRLLSVVC